MSSNDFEERVVTVPLRKVKASPALNETVWARGQQNPPSKLRVRAARFVEDGEPIVEAEPAR
jgi:large subunit ribosomal protein L31e